MTNLTKYKLLYDPLDVDDDSFIYILDSETDGFFEFSMNFGTLKQVNDKKVQILTSENTLETTEVYGIMGAFEFYPYGYFLLCVMDCQLVTDSQYSEYEIYKVLETSFPFFNFTSKQTGLNVSFKPQMKSTYISLRNLLLSISNQNGLYFSKQRNLTERIVDIFLKSSKMSDDKPKKQNFSPPLDKSKFLINHYAKTNISLDINLQTDPNFLIDVIQGYFCGQILKINDSSVYIELLYKRLQLNNGRRFFNRGIDNHGNPANFIEVEMLFRFNNKNFVFYITRGSVPIVFNQLPTPSGREIINVVNDLKQNSAHVINHLNILMDQYGSRVLVISLLDHEGREKVLSRAFTDSMYYIIQQKSLEDKIQYINYDFHHQTKGMKYDNIKQVVEEFKQYFSENLYYEFDEDMKVRNVQKGICRINCVDSLDRTGVVTNSILKSVLIDFLVINNIITSGQEIPHDVDCFLRETFADSSDILSHQYCGTKANKSDYTRTGVRTINGKLNDVLISIRRKILSISTDPQVEDAYRLFLGKSNLGRYFRSSNIYYPYFTNLKSNEIMLLILCSMFLCGISNLFHLFFTASLNWKNLKYPFVFIISSGYFLNKFSNKLILMPRFQKKD